MIDELEFIGRDDSVEVLRSDWNSGSMVDLARILEFAQFPKPMDGNP